MQNPPKFALEMFSNAAFSEEFKIGGSQDLTDWLFQVQGKYKLTDATAAITFTVTLDAAARKITIFADQVSIAALFSDDYADLEKLKIEADLLCRPGTEYPVRLASFDFSVGLGATSWT